MKKKILISVVLVIVLAAGGYYLLKQRGNGVQFKTAKVIYTIITTDKIRVFIHLFNKIFCFINKFILTFSNYTVFKPSLSKFFTDINSTS